ncbi:MAG: hypothetical protein ACUZ8I_04515, partial [Candidatus Scalindua sp.]
MSNEEKENDEKKEIFEIIGDYVQDDPSLSARKLTIKIIEDGNNCGLGDRAIRYRISDFKDVSGDIDVEESDYQK